MDLTINSRLVIPSNELRWRFSRSSGPGGQSVNTTDSRVELIFDIKHSSVIGPFCKKKLIEQLERRCKNGCLKVIATDQRSQYQNRQLALARMASLLREGLKQPSPTRKPTKPSRSSNERRLQVKKHRSKLKADRKSPEIN